MSVRKTAGFLSPNRISELIWGSESEEAGASSDINSEDKRGIKNKPGVSHLQPDRPTSCCQPSRSSISSIASDEENVFQSRSGMKWRGVERKVVSEVLRKNEVCVCVCVCICI
jgi:hypothetical protein